MERTTESEELLDKETDEELDEDLDTDPEEKSEIEDIADADEGAAEDTVAEVTEDTAENVTVNAAKEVTEDNVGDAAGDTEDTDEDVDEDIDEDVDEDTDEDADEDIDDTDEESDEDYDEDSDESEEGMGLNLFTFLVLLIAAAIAAVYFNCTVKTVHVSGNNLYTSEEIAEYVISDDTQLRHNTVFLTLLFMTPWAPEIPFEEKVRVTPESYDTIMITVKDMEIAGFIPYAGKNLYFSPDGIVLENSPLTVKNATFVTGISVTEGEIGKKIASENDAGLGLILEALQILNKYEMKAECLVLSKSGSVIMYLDKIKVQLGRSDYELKISKIAQLRPYLEDRSGTIDMTNYSSSDENVILK